MGVKNRQKVIVLVQKIQETQELLSRLESELDLLTIPDDSPSSTPEPPSRKTLSPRAEGSLPRADLRKGEASLPEQILALMRRDPHRNVTSDDFRELEAKGLPMPNIRVALVRLHKAGRLLKTSRGCYKLAPAEASTA